MTLPILGAAGKKKSGVSSWEREGTTIVSSTIFHLYHPPFWNLQSFHLIGFWKQSWPIAIDVSRPVKSKQHADFPRKRKFPQILWLKRAGNMVRHLDINYVFKHPFEKVTRAYFKKYSCGKETNVTAITVLEHKIDPETAEEYVVRRGECVNVLPGILRKLCPFGKIEVEEEAWLNKKEKYLRLHCYNLTWSKYASLEEFSCYRTCENNPDWFSQ
ncbi:PRELI domain-containing protein 2-like isoform X2 [Montipora capricornis]|uniref:PRELI domain-containing protein 2-like isoform X2 n=1 Tax=Montipora capricornis TaxID=246305 RepID=UPI0035F1678F